MGVNFSVVVIARNEAKTLPRMMASLTEFLARGGDVCILDTGSTDGTPGIARALGASVYEAGDKHTIHVDAKLAREVNAQKVCKGEEPVLREGDRIFNFAAARNDAASHAKCDMVSTPDCDEAYVALDIDAVEAAIAGGAGQLEFSFVFAYDEFGAEAVRFTQGKFYDRRLMKWVGIIHETQEGEVRRQYLPEHVLKIGHWQNHSTDRTGYLRGLAVDCYLHPEKDRNSHYFGRELLYHRRPLSAIRELERHVAMDRWPTEKSQSLIYIGDAYRMLGQPEKAVESYHRAYYLESARREPFMKLANHYWELNDVQRVACYATAALQIAESGFYANDVADYTFRPHMFLAQALHTLGRREESNVHHAKALEYRPLDSKLLHDLRFHGHLPTVDIILPTMRPAGMRLCMESIARLNYPQELVQVWKDDRDGMTVPQKVAEGVAATSGEFICYAADDMTFEPDSLVHAAIAGREHALVAFNAGDVLPDEGNVCEHFIVRRSFLPEIGGHVFDTDFWHVGCDNLLWAKAKRLGQAVRCERAKIQHRHFSRGAPMDEHYERSWSKVIQDRETLRKKLAELEQPAPAQAPQLQLIPGGAETELCRIAHKYRSDKCPQLGHAYTPFYAKLFEGAARERVRRVLEIGIGYQETMPVENYTPGASLRMWRDYFQNAMVYGADLRADLLFSEHRILCAQVDQSQSAQLVSMAADMGMNFDLIVDDGSHVTDHQIITAIALLPYVVSGGYYVVEDVQEPEKVAEALQQFGYAPVVHVFDARKVDDCLVVVSR
jgi:glycosyltransferase involved in cell wall biosynthesis